MYSPNVALALRVSKNLVLLARAQQAQSLSLKLTCYLISDDDEYRLGSKKFRKVPSLCIAATRISWKTDTKNVFFSHVRCVNLRHSGFFVLPSSTG
jgi:hypothetical protein